MSSSPREWFESLPYITRHWLAGSVIVAVGSFFGFIDPMKLLFFPSLIYNKFEIWRLATSWIFLGMPSMTLFWHILFLVKYVRAYEASPYPSGGGGHDGNTADFAFCLMFCAALIMPLAWWLSFPTTGTCLLWSIFYLWSRRKPDDQFSFFFLKVESFYAPWLVIGIWFLMGQPVIIPLLGICVGHVYYFIQYVLPTSEYQISSFLKTPQFLVRAFKVVDSYRGPNWRPPLRGAAAAPPPPTRTWGSGGGYTLGRGEAPR